MAKKGKVGKVVGAIVAIALIGGASVYGYKVYKDYQESRPPQQTIQTLETPDNFAFDNESYVLTWDDVEHAEGYTIAYNGENIEVDAGETSQAVLLASTENTFKIKANGDGVNYKDSAWSDAITYTVQNTEELSLFEKINIELNRAATEEGYTIERVIGISYADVEEDYWGSNLFFQTISTKNDKSLNDIPGASDLMDMLSKVDETTFESNDDIYNIVNYNSAEKLIASKRYDGEMEALRVQGYEISVLDSCVREGKGTSKFRFEIVGTYKATLGDDVKYFTSINQVDVLNPGTDKYNYETALEFKGKTTVEETQFVMHESGATLEYMEKLIAQKQSVATTSLSVEYSMDNVVFEEDQFDMLTQGSVVSNNDAEREY